EQFPSHGRGRRFNPYSAHHISTTYRQLPAVAGRTSRKHARSNRGESVDFVRGLSARATVGVIVRQMRNMLKPDQWDSVLSRARGTIYRGIERISSLRS